ncbi:MAG: hypothetical protein QG657_1655 [Acidobacteriota bacterium]|nr:hypothetical protein [Acidobacteriota bacterium]
MRKKNVIAMIGMIIGVFVFFSSQLTAEEAVGVSIFTGIKLPNRHITYNKTVWAATIRQTGATWIKIHFSGFLLNHQDYLDIINKEGQIIEQIRMEDVAGKHGSKFKVTINDDQTLSFWGPAIDGDEVKIILHRVSHSNKKGNWGFTIDEVGIGIDSIIKKNMIYEGRTVNNLSQLSGWMLYRKGINWYTCKGSLTNEHQSGNHFLPDEHCIDSRDVVDALEVRFYMNYSKEGKNYTSYYTYYGDDYVDKYSTYDHGLLTLKNNRQMPILHSNLRNSEKIPDISRIYSEVYDYCYCDCDCDCIDEQTCCSNSCSNQNSASGCDCNCCSGSFSCNTSCCCGYN